jgi:two-component system, cell cycle response regulator DivK
MSAMAKGNGTLVLIVEDNPKNLKLARDVLQFHGFRTVEATTGEDGIGMAREHRPDLILMDIALPGIDGVDATAALKAEPGTAAIPVVALTASVMQSDRARFEQAGFAGLIAKPIDVLTFPDQVLSYCASPGRSAGTA